MALSKDWPYPRIFAHRGGGKLAPENTLAAICTGQSLGYRAHEFDVKLSQDGIAFLLHDDTLERTSDGQGDAGDKPWRELAGLDAGAWHSEAFRGEPLARFDAAAALLRLKGTLANIEIKPSPGREQETGEKVAARAAELWKGASVPPLLSSFSFEALLAAKGSAPDLPRAWLVEEFAAEDWKRLAELGAVSLNTSHKKFDRENLARLHDKGYRVMLYTVNDLERAAELLAWGVDGLFTDNLKEFAARFPGAI